MTQADRGTEAFERIGERLGVRLGIIEADGTSAEFGREVVWRASGRSQFVAVAHKARVESMNYWRARVVTSMVLGPGVPAEFTAPRVAELNERAMLGTWLQREHSIDFFSYDAVGDVPAAATPFVASLALAAAGAYALGAGLRPAISLGAETLGTVPELQREEVVRVAEAVKKVDAELLRLYRSGKKSSHWADSEEISAAMQALVARATEVSTGSFGLEAEFPFGSRTSILRVRPDARDEEFGTGCLMWLLLPYVMNRMNAGLTAHRLNTEEFEQRILGPGLGAWTIWPDRDRPTVGYRTFLPNGIFRRGELRRHVLGMEVRSRMAQALMATAQPPAGR